MRSQTQIIDTQLPIEKALEFVGDNCRYQKKRLGIIAITVLSLAILTNRVALEHTSVILLFLIASGAGQIVCPIYMSLRTCTLGVGASALFAIGAYPMGTFLKSVAFLCMGFFSRGFFVSSLIYINEIGGDRFRAWSTLVIYGLWAISTLFNSIDEKLGLSRWIGYYLFVFLPCLVSVYFVLQYWQPSPLYLYFKSISDVVQGSSWRLRLCFHRWLLKMIGLTYPTIWKDKMTVLRNRSTGDPHIWISSTDHCSEGQLSRYACCGYIGSMCTTVHV